MFGQQNGVGSKILREQKGLPFETGQPLQGLTRICVPRMKFWRKPDGKGIVDPHQMTVKGAVMQGVEA